jgi:uncharacterized protein YndB with AHSA1/START domain
MFNHPIIIERLFNVPVTIVWNAISDKEEMKKWYFDLAEFKAVPGFKFSFTGGSPEGRQYLHLCEIQEALEKKKLSYTWRYEGYPGISLVSFELADQESNTILKLTHSAIESFGNENSDFAKENFVTGWNHIINVSLKDYLEKSSAGR